MVGAYVIVLAVTTAVANWFVRMRGRALGIATAGNVAFPFTPPEIDCGPAFRFALYHVMHGIDPAALFQVALNAIDGTD